MRKIKSLKIGIDAGPLASGHSIRGIGVYVRELIKALGQKGVDVKNDDLSKYDIVHFTSFKPFEVSLPFFKPKNTKFVLTIYDLIPLIYPKNYPAGIKGKIKFLINKFLIQKNVDVIITISETSKKDICRFLNIKPKKVYVIYLAPRENFGVKTRVKLKTISKKYKLPEKFVLYVGDINYNKNIPVLLKACEIADVNLVIVGKQALDIEDGGMDIRSLRGPMDYIRFLFNLPHPELKHYQSLQNSFKNNPKVFRLGFVPDSDLAEIYKLATVYCQPSLYEGFGLPVLEAFSSGCPVVSSKTQALVEIAEAAALFADPQNPNDFAQKILEILNNNVLREQLINTGRVLASKFSWQKTAKQTYDVYKSLIRND